MKDTDYGRLPAEQLDATFAALASPTRRAILARLSRGELSVTELAEPFAMSQPAISLHLKVSSAPAWSRAARCATAAGARRGQNRSTRQSLARRLLHRART
jgi:DNA-binding transcriptional ArsR family regulator